MIAYKNQFKEPDEDLKDNQPSDLQFKINNKILTLKKNYTKLRNIILSYANNNENLDKEQLIEIPIPNLTLHYLFRYVKNDEYKKDFSFHSDWYLDVLYSNFDGINGNDKYEDYLKKEDNYFDNQVLTKSQISLFSYESKKDKKNIESSYYALEQFQLLLDGHDILIPDFFVDDMLLIAEKFEIDDLKEALNLFKNEINDADNYHRFSELEILQQFTNILYQINDENFDEKSRFIHSIYSYTRNYIFHQIKDYFFNIFPEKYDIYSRLYELIGINAYNKKINDKENQIENSSLLTIIKNDDIDSFITIVSNPAYDISDKSIELSSLNVKKSYYLSNTCNPIECAAFFGSIKCFKYLLLNTKLELNNVIKYAIIGGNTEIIRICHQKKIDFNKTLNIAIEFHRNDIVQWIYENKLDTDYCYNIDYLLSTCLYKFNFDMFQYFYDLNQRSTSIEEQMTIKYIYYVFQNYQSAVISVGYFDVYFYMYKCIKSCNNFDLIYLAPGKIDILKLLMNEMVKDYFNHDINNLIIFLFHLIF